MITLPAIVSYTRTYLIYISSGHDPIYHEVVYEQIGVTKGVVCITEYAQTYRGRVTLNTSYSNTWEEFEGKFPTHAKLIMELEEKQHD